MNYNKASRGILFSVGDGMERYLCMEQLGLKSGSKVSSPCMVICE